MTERYDGPSGEAPHFHGRCRGDCARPIWRDTPPRAYSDICNECYRVACWEYDDKDAAPRRLDWTLNECDPDERVVEHGND